MVLDVRLEASNYEQFSPSNLEINGGFHLYKWHRFMSKTN
jgi:hypothetical protein